MKSVTERVDGMLHRSLSLHGWQYDENGRKVPTQKATQEFLKTLASAEPDPQEQANTLIAAWEDGTGAMMKSLNAVRVEQVSNFIRTESNFMSAFFEQVTLQPNEQPYVTNETMQEIRVGHIGEDGTPDSVRVVKPQSATAIALRMIASEKVRYKTMDIYKGDVSGSATATFSIADDLTFKLDREHYDLLTATTANGGAFGVFSFEQARTAKEKRIYLAHSGIVTAHLPTTNDYNMNDGANTTNNPTADGTLTEFGIKVLKAIIDYADRWANVIPGGGRLQPTGEIILPSSDIIAIANDATPSSNTQENRIQEEINRQGYTTLTYLGRTWRFIADVTIPAGTCFPRFNMVPGRSYSKPNFDREFVETNEVEMWEERFQRKVYGAYVISQYRPRAMRIKYIA